MTEQREPIFRLTKKDFEIQTFRSGGPGGQHQNKTESGVRIIHRPSGAIGECRSERSQHQNKQLAFRRLCADPKLLLWAKIQIGELLDVQAEAEKYAEHEINTPEHIQTEIKRNGQWIIVEGELSE